MHFEIYMVYIISRLKSNMQMPYDFQLISVVNYVAIICVGGLT